MNLLFKKNTLVLLLLLCAHSFCKADDLILASATSQATIIVGHNATAVERYAAEEVQRTLGLMSGSNLNIADENTATLGVRIVIGTPATNAEISGMRDKLKLAGANDEQTAVLRDGNTVYLAGQTPRAALYAAYTFLEDVLGARWLWPGSTGEFIPRRSIVSVGELSIFETPRITMRSLSVTDVTNSTPETDAWEARNKMNIVAIPAGSSPTSPVIVERLKKGFQTRIAGHNVVLPASTLNAHPEYVAQYNGSRAYTSAATAQLCWGNAGVQNEVANMIAKWWDQTPFIDIVHFYPADNQTYCQDSLCRALAPDVSTRWQKFSQIVMEKIDQTHPGRRYWTFAYQGYRPVPTTVASRFESVGYTQYDGSYRYLLSSGYSGNQNTMNEIDGWLSKGVKMGIRGYEYIMFKDPMYVPLVSWETDQMSWIVNKGIAGGYSSELPPYGYPKAAAPEETYWNCNRMNLYAAAKSMWSNIPADSIVKDWCATVYGPASAAMVAYYWDIEQLWRNAPGNITKYNNSPAAEVDNFLSPESFERLNSYFSQARTKLASITDTAIQAKIAAQIDLESKMLANWQAVYNFKKGRADHFKTAIVKTAQVDETTWQTAQKLPPFEEKSGKTADEQTVVSMAWTPTDLVLRIVCQDNNIAQRKTLALTQDGNVRADDCVELFMQPNSNSPSYMHFAVNSKAVKYDAISNFGGMDFDVSWNPAWTATTTVSSTDWTINVKIPFASLGITASDSSQFKMAVKRSRAGRAENSGWPDASYFNPASFGLATLVSQIVQPIDKKIILYDNAISTSAPVSVEFQQRDWSVAAGVTGETQLREKLNDDAAVLLIKYTSTSTFLSTNFYQNEIKNFLEKGRVVIIAATRSMPVETWFPGVPAIRWSGNSQQSGNPRTSTYLLPGLWQTYPNNITSPLKKSFAPVSAYSVLSDGWQIRAKMRMIDGTDQPFLFSKRIGKGLLVVTSSAMGYSGGYEMFGNNYMANVVSLVENLRAEQVAYSPNITTSALSVNNDEGACSATISLDSPAIGNGFEVASITNDHPSTTYPVGTTTVTWTATDVHGYRDNATQLITVTDNEAPVINGLPSDTVLVNDKGVCGAVVTWEQPTANDNCGIQSFSGDHASGETFPIGTTTVTYTATDIHGNTITSSFDVTVKDLEAPVITCPSDIQMSACESTATWTVPTATDNCPGAVITQTGGPAAGSTFANGSSTKISYSARDASGNTSNCSFTVSRAPALTASCAANNATLYFGMSGDQTATIKVMPVGGVAPYKIEIAMNRPLRCNVISSTGNETWTAGAGTASNTNTFCPGAGSNVDAPVSVANSVPVGGFYSVNAALMADAIFTATVTDANGCTITCSTSIHATDVRCFAGNNAKVEICHKTGNPKNPCVQICVDESAVAEHLAHGDFLGKCTADCLPPVYTTQMSATADLNARDIAEGTTVVKTLSVKLAPNPTANYFTLKMQSASHEEVSVTVVDVAGRVIEKRTHLAPNTTIRLGDHYRAGVFIAEVVQGNEKVSLRMIKTGGLALPANE